MSLGIKGEGEESPPPPPKTKKEKAADEARQLALLEEAGVPLDEDAEERKLLIPVFCTADIPTEVFQDSFGLDVLCSD